MCRCCAWLRKKVDGTEARTHGPERSILMLKSQVRRQLDHPGALVDLLGTFVKALLKRCGSLITGMPILSALIDTTKIEKKRPPVDVAAKNYEIHISYLHRYLI